MLNDKFLIVSEFKTKSGIYLIHNLVNGKQYVGSSKNLTQRLSSYYSISKLIDNRYISRSILKYGHDNFSVLILELVESSKDIKKYLLSKEQHYLNPGVQDLWIPGFREAPASRDLLKPALNINPTAGYSLGYQHSEETKQLLSSLRMGKSLSEETKQLLSKLFSGELNTFWGKTHNLNTFTSLAGLRDCLYPKR